MRGDGTSSLGRSALTQSAFDRLLLSLDPNRDRAGEQYEQIRRRLVKFFECRGSSTPEDEADETLTRVGSRLEAGEAIANLPAYCYGVARFVLLETVRDRQRERATLESVAAERPAGEDQEADDRLKYLEQCLATLPAASRELVLSYYQGDHAERIRRRQALAARLEVPMNALRIRVHRLRAAIEACVRSKLGGLRR